MERPLSRNSLSRDSRVFCHPRAGGDLVVEQARDSRFRGNDTDTKTMFACIALLLSFLLFSSWLMVHTFGYDNTQKNILMARSVWSDFGSHIPLIRSFSMGDNFDKLMRFQAPEYPLFSGEPIRYHFLFYMVVGLLEKMGLRLDWALNIPSVLGFTLLLGGVWSLAMVLFHDKKVAFLSIIFFLFNGSLSFFKFFADHPLSFNTPLDIIRATSFPAFGPWDGGTISAFWNLNIYTNQRHLAWGFALGIWFLAWITSTSRQSVTPAHAGVQRKTHPLTHWIPAYAGMTFPSIFWGIAIGILPYFHQPMLLVFAVLLSWYFLAFPHLRKTLFMTALIAFLLIVPQMTSIFLSFTRHPELLFRHPGLDPGSIFTPNWIPAFAGMTMDGFRSLWYPGYLAHDRLSFATFLSFWFQNLGLHAIIIPLGFFLIPKPSRRILFPLFLLFAIGNLFKFSMEVAANHKFFNFALILGNMITAYTIVMLFMRHPRVREDPENNKTPIHYFLHWIPAFAGMTILLVFLTLSGVIDFFVIANDTKGTLADVGSPRFVGEAGNNQTATWIAQNTPKDAVFLNSSFLYHPASLAGRKIFMGWPYFAWSAGYDTYKRNDEMKLLYESRDPSVFCPLLTQHNISYITVEDTKGDPNLPFINLPYFRDHYEPVFENADSNLRIYQTSTLCPGY